MRDRAAAGVAVVGSLNLDRVVGVPHLPHAGETLLADAYAAGLGGKGANQAVAAARHGVDVAMVGRVGDDPEGRWLLDALALEGIDVSGVATDAEAPTGVAHIAVAADGANSIIVVAGANAALGPGDVRRELERLPAVDVVLIQMEIPLDAVAAAVATDGATVILNPAPAQPLPDALLAGVDVLVPNLPELAALTGGGAVGSVAEAAARGRSLAAGRALVVTLGEWGALVLDGEGETHIPAPSVDAIDTTAAGDAFCGSLAGTLAQGASLRAAVAQAVRVGALTTTRRGALDAIPTRAEIGAAPA